MIGQVIQAMKVNQKCKEKPPKSLKNEMPVFGLLLTSDDQPSDPSDESWPKCKEKPPKSSKEWNAHFWITFNFWWLAERSNKSWPKCKKSPLSHKNEMLIFGLRSTSDDWPSDLSDESWPKCKKKPP